jgi:uncharacterized membrane protein YqgA involved in biofilm formation
MDPWSALGYIFLGITLGIIGQIIRIGIGLKKTYDEANQKNVNLDSLFDKKQLLISLLIAIAVGAGAGSLGVLQYIGKDITQETIIALIKWDTLGLILSKDY